MDLYYLFIIIATLIGFCGLAWLLLAPIWRFLDREQEASEEWTKEALARRRREHQRSHHDRQNRERETAPGDSSGADAPEASPSGDGASPSKER